MYMYFFIYSMNKHTHTHKHTQLVSWILSINCMYSIHSCLYNRTPWENIHPAGDSVDNGEAVMSIHDHTRRTLRVKDAVFVLYSFLGGREIPGIFFFKFKHVQCKHLSTLCQLLHQALAALVWICMCHWRLGAEAINEVSRVLGCTVSFRV